jgi:hypothetical protein
MLLRYANTRADEAKRRGFIVGEEEAPAQRPAATGPEVVDKGVQQHLQQQMQLQDHFQRQQIAQGSGTFFQPNTAPHPFMQGMSSGSMQGFNSMGGGSMQGFSTPVLMQQYQQLMAQQQQLQQQQAHQLQLQQQYNQMVQGGLAHPQVPYALDPVTGQPILAPGAIPGQPVAYPPTGDPVRPPAPQQSPPQPQVPAAEVTGAAVPGSREVVETAPVQPSVAVEQEQEQEQPAVAVTAPAVTVESAGAGAEAAGSGGETADEGNGASANRLAAKKKGHGRSPSNAANRPGRGTRALEHGEWRLMDRG